MGVGLEYGEHGWFCGPVGAIFGLFTQFWGIHPKMSIVRVHWVLRVFGCVRLYGGACGDLLWVWGVGFGYVGISLAILLQFWGIDPKMSIVGSCGLGWSEKVKVAIVKNFSQFLNHVTTVSSEQLTGLKSDHFSFAKLGLLFYN